MIYTAHKTDEDSFVSFNEATGTEVTNFISKEDIPKDFKKTALKIIDAIETEGIMTAKGGANNDAGDVLSIFTRNARDGVEDRGDDVRSYYFRIPQKFSISFLATPEKYRNFAYKIFAKAGLKKGQQIANGKMFGHYFYKSAKTKSGKPCYFIGYIHTTDQGLIKNTINMVLQCVKYDEKSKSWIESTGTFISSESATDNGFEYDTPDLTNKDNDGYETKRSLEDYLGYNPDQGLVRSEELTKGEFEDYFRDSKIMDKFTEHMDLTDNATRKSILYMTEAEQGVVLTSLTSKLYDNIVVKVDDIDYGDIPATKGDLTKLPNYEKLNECLGLLHDILREYKQDTGPVDEISTAMGNVVTRKELFGRAFRMNIELPIIMYNNVVLAIIESISLMIATCIEFIKVPNQDSFEIVLDKVAYAKTKSNMIYNTLKKFNKCCEKGDFDKGMEHVIQTKVGKGMREAGAVLAGLGIGVVILLSIIPILRELVFLFYHIRMRVSDFFDIQADLIQMNTYSLENRNDIPKEDKERTISKQLKIVELFRKIANKISFTAKKAEVNATKDITDASRKVKIDELDSGVPDSVASSLF